MSSKVHVNALSPCMIFSGVADKYEVLIVHRRFFRNTSARGSAGERLASCELSRSS
jgi:hypothetical protein